MIAIIICLFSTRYYRKEVAFVLLKGKKFIHSINLDEKQPKRKDYSF